MSNTTYVTPISAEPAPPCDGQHVDEQRGKILAHYGVHTIKGSEAKTQNLCQHHLVKLAEQDSSVLQAMESIGTVTLHAGGSFTFERRK